MTGPHAPQALKIKATKDTKSTKAGGTRPSSLSCPFVSFVVPHDSAFGAHRL
jgi:hypothetical protein